MRKAAVIPLLAILLFLTSCGAGDFLHAPIIDPGVSGFETEAPAVFSDPGNASAVPDQTAYPESYNHYFYADEASLETAIPAGSYHFDPSRRNNNADRRITYAEYEPEEVTVREQDHVQFDQYLDSISVSYTYAPYYHIAEALDKADSYASARAKQSSHFTGLICEITEIPSVELLQDVISANSDAYLRSHPGFSQPDPEETQSIVQIIHDMVETNYFLWDDENLRRVYSLLSNISVVEIDSYDFTVNDLMKPYNARVLEDCTIIIDTATMEKMLRGDNAKEKTYEHEIYHLFQRMCPDAQIENYTQIGCSQYFEDLRVNSLHWNWLYEAAAEKKVMKHYRTMQPLVYKNMIGYLRSLDFITLLRPEYNESAVEDSTLTVDSQNIFDLLGAQTSDEKEEIIRMLYSIDYLQNNRDDLEEMLKEDGITADAETRISIKKDMKNSICLTFAKIFYRNLADLAYSGSVSMQDIFYLINAFEEDVSYHTTYDEETPLYRSFIESYSDLQDRFFAMLAGNDDAASEALTDSFLSYSMALMTENGIQRNCGLEAFTDSERDFIFEEMVSYNMSYMTENIRLFLSA